MMGLYSLIDRERREVRVVLNKDGRRGAKAEERNEGRKRLQKQQVTHSIEYEGLHIWWLCNWRGGMEGWRDGGG